MAKRNNHGLLGLRLWYLMYFGAENSLQFMPLLFEQTMHFNATQIGALLAMRRALRLVGAPVFTYVLDRTRTHRVLVPLCLLSYYILCSVLAFQRGLPLVALTMLLQYASNSGIDSAVNSAAMGALADENEIRKNTGQPLATYGRLRLFGSVGRGTMSLAIGYALDLLFDEDMRYAMFAQTAIGVFVLLVVVFLVDLSPELFERVEQCRSAATSKALESGSQPVVDSQDWWISVVMFVLNVVMLNITFGISSSSMFLYMSSLRVPNCMLGLSTFINCSFEATCFNYHGKISKWVGGDQNAFRMSIISNIAAMLLLANVHLASQPAVPFIIARMIVGFAFAMYWASAVHLSADMAPVGRETSAQGMLSALGWGLGAAIGAFLGGIGLHTLGAPLLYTLTAVCQLFVLLVPLMVSFCITRTRRYNSGYNVIVGDGG